MTWKFPPNAIHVSLDLETAGLSSKAAIVQIGAAAYLPRTDEGIPEDKEVTFTRYISVLDNEINKREVSVETMEWWNKQDPAIRKRVFGGTYPLKEALYEFIDWCSDISSNDLSRICIWGNGCNFDNVILKDAIEQYFTWPFHYRNDHHLRTLMALVPEDVQERASVRFTESNGKQAHDALWDARYQLWMIRTGLVYHGIKTN